MADDTFDRCVHRMFLFDGGEMRGVWREAWSLSTSVDLAHAPSFTQRIFSLGMIPGGRTTMTMAECSA